MGRAPLTRAEVADIVTAEAGRAKRDHVSAMKRSDWHAALEHLSTSLMWRSVTLALRLGFAGPGVLKTHGGAIAIAHVVSANCVGAMRRAGKSSDPSSDYWKAIYIQDVVLGVAGTVAALQDRSLNPTKRLFLVAVNSLTLGRHDATLAMAESGHWDTIGLIYRRRSKGGKNAGQGAKDLADKTWRASALLLVNKNLHRNLTRNGWATFIKADKSICAPSIRQVEEWLKAEVEEPNGPLPSRARTKAS